MKGLPERWSRPLLGAVVSPQAAHEIVRGCGATMLEQIQRYEQMGTPWATETARHLRAALGQMQEAARQWRYSDAVDASVVAFTEGLEDRACAGCSHLPPQSDDASPWVSAERVATRAGVSAEAVRDLCRKGQLVATRGEGRGRPWLIQPESAAEWLEDRGVTG